MAEHEIIKAKLEGGEPLDQHDEKPPVNHGDFPPYLIIIFIFIGIWAAFSWIPLFGY